MNIKYTIRYAYAGIYQYADIRFKDGIIFDKSFRPRYVSNNTVVPSLDNADNIEEILEIIKGFSYNKRAEIYLINGNYPEYHYNEQVKVDVKIHSDIINNTIKEELYLFFTTHIAPILIKNNWFISTSWCGHPVLINKDENGEWQNIKNERDGDLIEFMCFRLLNEVGLYDGSVDFRKEQGDPYLNGFYQIMKHISSEVIEKSALFVTISE